MQPPATLSTREFQAQPGLEDWRGLARTAAAWFDAPSHAAGAELVARALRTAAETGVELPDIDLRSSGVRIQLARDAQGFDQASVNLARTISSAARDLGLVPDPSAVQDVQVTVDAVDHGRVMSFWETALGHQRDGEEDLVDPDRRRIPLWFQEQDAPRPLRNRIHLDSVAPQDLSLQAVETLDAPGGAAGRVDRHGYYATVADSEGNEVDLLPLPEGADRWGDDADDTRGDDTDDWRLVFSAMAAYPTPGMDQTVDLVTAAALAADDAGLPLCIDVRPTHSVGPNPSTPAHAPTGDGADPDPTPAAVVILDTGKDQWEVEPAYRALAAQVQRAARDLGLTADPTRARFTQIGIDAVDIDALRRFWCAALGYRPDPRADVTDLVDPRRLGPVLFFQPLDPEDDPDGTRRAQRNRLHIDIFLPDDQAQDRLQTALDAGGHVVRDMSPFWWTVADPEGNEVDLSVVVGREEHWG